MKVNFSLKKKKEKKRNEAKDIECISGLYKIKSASECFQYRIFSIMV